MEITEYKLVLDFTLSMPYFFAVFKNNIATRVTYHIIQICNSVRVKSEYVSIPAAVITKMESS